MGGEEKSNDALKRTDNVRWNETMRRVRATFVAVEKQLVLYIVGVYL